MGGGKDMYRHKITTKHASRQRNLLNACTTKDNLDSVGNKPVPVAARAKAQVFGRSPAEIVGSNPTRGMDICLL